MAMIPETYIHIGRS